MHLVQIATMTLGLLPPQPIGAGPIGNRTYFGIRDGAIMGDKLNGIVTGGGEWALGGPDGFFRIDVRLQMTTWDGAHLYIQYFGLLELNAAVQAAMANGTETGFGDQYLYTNPRMETGDPRYAWVNTTFFVGRGRVAAGLGVEYQIWTPE